MRILASLSLKNKAILLVAISVGLFALLNCLMRMLTGSFTAYQILAYRSFYGLLFASVGLMIIGFKSSGNIAFTRQNLLRGLFDLASIPLWITALKYMQITQVVSIAFLTPVICAILAGITLQDRMPINKWVACLVALVGAFVVAHPDVSGFNYYGFLVLGTCILWASSGILLKKLSIKRQHPLVIIAYTNAVIFCMTLPFMITSFQALSLEKWLLLTVMGIIAFLANFALAHAYRLTQITNLLPFEYLKLVYTAIFSFILFGEVISTSTIMGSLIILAAAYYLVKSGKEKCIDAK
jgi:drug/metabolite transporter (DMT)-like permease